MTRKLYHTLRESMLVGLILITLILSSCKKEEAKLTPTEEPEKTWVFPQGKNSYDQRIVDYHKKWGTYILYKFSYQDIAWQVTKYDPNYKAIPADEAYVEKQLDLLDLTFFKYYQDSTLKKYLPVKLFLCSSLRVGANVKEIDAYLMSPTSSVASIAVTMPGGYESFAVNWGKEAILNINTVKDTTTIFKNNVNFSFLKMADINGRMQKSEDFLFTSDYTTPLVATTTTERYKRGFIGNAGAIPIPNTDWYTYLQAAISTSYEDLTNETTPATNNSYNGILNSLKDPTGLIRKKYDLMVDHYLKVYNIDLRAIGNDNNLGG